VLRYTTDAQPRVRWPRQALPRSTLKQKVLPGWWPAACLTECLEDKQVPYPAAIARSGDFPAPDGQHLLRVPETIRVALVNDYEIVLEGLRAILRPYKPEITVVELDVEGNPHSAVDVTLFDTYGEAQELRQRVRGLAADATNGAIVVFSFSDDAALASTYLRAGAQGFISKALPAEQIVDGIRATARGERVTLVQASPHSTMSAELEWPGRNARLTERESELLALLPTGMSNRELSEHLHVSENTIKSHLRRLFSKLKVRNRAQAAALARTSILGESRSRSTVTNASDAPARPKTVERPVGRDMVPGVTRNRRHAWSGPIDVLAPAQLGVAVFIGSLRHDISTFGTSDPTASA
jgi:NarL family two-component system response regulator LiaR